MAFISSQPGNLRAEIAFDFAYPAAVHWKTMNRRHVPGLRAYAGAMPLCPHTDAWSADAAPG